MYFAIHLSKHKCLLLFFQILNPYVKKRIVATCKKLQTGPRFSLICVKQYQFCLDRGCVKSSLCDCHRDIHRSGTTIWLNNIEILAKLDPNWC